MRLVPIVVLLCQVAAGINRIHTGSIPTAAAADISQSWIPPQPRHLLVPSDTTSEIIPHDSHHQRIERRKLELPSPKKIYNNIIDKLTDKFAGAFHSIIYNVLEIGLNTLRDLLTNAVNSIINNNILPKISNLLKGLVKTIRDTLVSAIAKVRDWFTIDYQVFVTSFIVEKTRFYLRKQFYWKGTEPVPLAVGLTNCLNADPTSNVVMLSSSDNIKLPESTVVCKSIPTAVPAVMPTTGALGVIRKISDSVAVGLIVNVLNRPLRFAVNQAVKLSTGLIHHTVYSKFVLNLQTLVGSCKVMVAPAQLGLDAIGSAVNTVKKAGTSARKWIAFQTVSLITWLKRSPIITKAITDNMLNNAKNDNTAISNNSEKDYSKDTTASDKMDINELSLSLKTNVATVPDVTVAAGSSHLGRFNSQCDQINAVFRPLWELIEEPVKAAVNNYVETLSKRLQDRSVEQLTKNIQLAINDIVPIYPDIAAGQKN
jgi:hypothetical protein